MQKEETEECRAELLKAISGIHNENILKYLYKYVMLRLEYYEKTGK